MVAEKFIQNVKALSERRLLTEDELKLVMVCIQEVATISPVELISLLDNVELVIEEGQHELSVEEYEQIRRELLDSVGVDDEQPQATTEEESL
jgi:hypothetical protein